MNLLEKCEIADCWTWQGHTDHGYGKVTLYGKTVWVHRFVYQALVGQLPPWLHLDHLCRNRRCCNPDHLQPVRQGENNRRSPKRQEFCKRGHPLSEAKVTAQGKRQCMTCVYELRRSKRIGMDPVAVLQ